MKGIIKKIKNLIEENRSNQKKMILQNQELEWAQIYHDSIRGKEWLENLPLNIGRWAGNYSFFYVLHRVLQDYKPKMILELGLGESTKFISTYMENYLVNSKHLVIEQDNNWAKSFLVNFSVSERTTIKICPIEKVVIKGFESNAYTNLAAEVNDKYDLYIVDGPHGTLRYSRYDIVRIAKTFTSNDEFIIILDDYDRRGEKDTAIDLMKELRQKNIKVFENCYTGIKNVKVIASQKYKYAESL